MIYHWTPTLQTLQAMFGEDRVPVGAMVVMVTSYTVRLTEP
jgi:hypothetical protein